MVQRAFATWLIIARMALNVTTNKQKARHMVVFRFFLLAAALLCVANVASAQILNDTIKVGVLSDFSGPLSDYTGKGSLLGAQLAAEDFASESGGKKVEILFADHQNKPDIGASIARKWVDQDGVAAVVDLANSGVALAVNNIMKEKNRTLLASATATSELTGKSCQPTTVQWAIDTWALANAMVGALSDRGAKSWFLLAADFALGKALVQDATEAIASRGGKVSGEVFHPFNTSDFASYLLQAQSSPANVIALANTGADAINALKQIEEFRIRDANRTIALLFVDTTLVRAMGLKLAQGAVVSEPFYWDLSEATRGWSKRFASRKDGAMPSSTHAAAYSATLAFLRAARDVNSIEGDKVVKQMKSKTIDDPLFGKVTIRPDGRAVHEMFVFQVKSPGESKSSFDLYKLLYAIPADKAFRPIENGNCPLTK